MRVTYHGGPLDGKENEVGSCGVGPRHIANIEDQGIVRRALYRPICGPSLQFYIFEGYEDEIQSEFRGVFVDAKK